MGRFEEILKSIAPGGATRYVVPPRTKSPVRKKKGDQPKQAKKPKEGENVDALDKLVEGASRSRRTDDVMDSVLERADAEDNKPTEGKGSRTPIRKEMPIEEIRSMIATPEGLAEVKRHIGNDPGNRKQKAIRAAMYARNKAWADEFDLALAGDAPAKPLDSGFEGVGAGEGAREIAEEGDGQYVSRPDDPPKRVAAEKDRGKKVEVDVEIKKGKNKGKIGKNSVNVTQEGDVTLVRKRLPEDRDREARLYKDDKGNIRAGGKTLAANLKNAYAVLRKEYNKFKKAGLATNADGSPYTFEQFKEDNAHTVTKAKIADEPKTRAKAVDGNGEKRRGYPAQSISSQSQAASQRGTATRAAGFDPAAPEGFSPGAAPEDVVPVSEYGTLRQRSTQPAGDRQDAARRLMDATFVRVKGQGTGSDQVLNYLRQVDDDTALKLAYKVSHDALIDRIPTAERATAVADHDAVHGVVQGLFEASGRKMPSTMPEWYNDIETTAQQKTEKLFPSRGTRTGAQPSRTPPASAPLPLRNKKFDPTIDSRPGPEPTLPVEQRPQGSVPKNIEEELADYRAGKVTDPEQKAYLEEIIETRRIAADNTLDENGKPIKGIDRKTPVKRKPKNEVLNEASDVTVADAPTTPGEELIVAKGKAVEAITGAAGKPAKKGKAGPAIKDDLAGKAADIDSGAVVAKGKGDSGIAQVGGFSTPLADRYSALAEDARNADAGRAQEMKDRLAALDAELAATPEAKRASSFDAAGSAEEAVLGMGTSIVAKPRAKGRGKPPAEVPPPVATPPAAKGKAGAKPPIAEPPVAGGGGSGKKPPAAPPSAGDAPPPPAQKGTQVGVSDDATGVDGDGNVDVTAKPRRVRTKPQPDTSEMESSRMADEGGMMPVGPNPMTPERRWLETEARLEEETYQNDLARRQQAVVDQKNRAAAAERARQQAQRDQWSQTEADVNEVGRRRDANSRSLAENDDMMGQLAQDGIARRRATDARMTDENGAMLDEMAGQASLQSRVRRGRDEMMTQQNGALLDDMAHRGSYAEGVRRAREGMFTQQNGDMLGEMAGQGSLQSRVRRGREAMMAQQNEDMMGSMARRVTDDRLTRENGDALFAAAQQMRDRNVDRARTRNATTIAAAGAIGGGIYGQMESERPAPEQPPQQVPDTHTNVGIPDEEVLDLGDPEDVSAPITRRLPPGFDPLRRPGEMILPNPGPEEEAAPSRLPPGFDPLRRPSELTLTNPNRDDLQLPDPHASEYMSLPDPNAGREMLAGRATNPDDPRAKLARLMKALNR